MKNLKVIFWFILIFGLTITVVSCDDDLLDFSSDTYFGIKTLLKSENCKADCGEMADCEGRMVRVRGRLDSSNINQTDNQFYLIDEDKDNFRLEVKVDETINEEVFEKLNGNGGLIFKVMGELEGFDAPTNANCNRLFLLKLDDATLVEME